VRIDNAEENEDVNDNVGENEKDEDD